MESRIDRIRTCSQSPEEGAHGNGHGRWILSCHNLWSFIVWNLSGLNHRFSESNVFKTQMCSTSGSAGEGGREGHNSEFSNREMVESLFLQLTAELMELIGSTNGLYNFVNIHVTEIACCGSTNISFHSHLIHEFHCHIVGARDHSADETSASRLTDAVTLSFWKEHDSLYPRWWPITRTEE